MNTIIGILLLATPFLLIGGLVGGMAYVLGKPTRRVPRTSGHLALVTPVRRWLAHVWGSPVR
jgi:hypothetical protein